MKKINIKFVATLICATMMLNNGYTLSFGNNVPNPVNVNTNYAVGEIPMTSSVSQTGAVTYTVPINVYPGINGMQPELSLVYNSQAGNGYMGMGWNIGGLSSIMRGNKSMYYDEKVEGIKMDKNDVFYLDGIRLIEVEQFMLHVIEYKTERGNIKVIAKLGFPLISNIDYFEVFYPDGTKAIYGSKLNKYNRLEYPLTELIDLYGNKIIYNYEYVENHFRITQIRYIYDGENANASVEFLYNDDIRSDVISFYRIGLNVKKENLLEKIVCKFKDQVVGCYELNYDYKALQEVSVLKEVWYSVTEGNYFNPLQFSYGEDNTSKDYSKSITYVDDYDNSSYGPQQMKIETGKFDFFNKDDDGLIVGLVKNPYYKTFVENNKCFINQYSSDDKIYIYTSLKNDTTVSTQLTSENGFIDIISTNVDDSAYDEIIKINNYAGTNDHLIFKKYKTSNEGISLEQTYTFNVGAPFIDKNGNRSVRPKYFFSGDFIGNGKKQIMAVSAHEPYGGNPISPTKCYIFDLESNTILYEDKPFSFKITFSGISNGFLISEQVATNNSDRIYIIDYDGDGKSDIFLINETGSHVYTYDALTNSIKFVKSYTTLKRSDLVDRLLFLGDFNGDGLADFLLSPKVNYPDWFIYYSKGDMTFDKVATSPFTRLNGDRYCLIDINMDGMTDLIKYTSKEHLTCLAINGGFSNYDSQKSLDNSLPLLVALNGGHDSNQLFELNNYGKDNNKLVKHSFSRNDTKESLLTEAVSSFGVIDKNQYEMLYKSDSFYSVNYDETLPIINYQGPAFVAKSKEQYFNGVMIENRSYSYQNAIIHTQGRGFMGFEEISENDIIRDRTKYQKFDPLNFGVLLEEETPFVKTNFEYDIIVDTNKIVQVNMTESKVYDKLKQTTITSTYTDFDNFGNAKNQTINYGGGISETITNVFANNLLGKHYYIGFLISQEKIITRNGETWSEKFTSPTLTPSELPRYNEITKYANGNQVSFETFTYHTNGNIENKSLQSFSSSKVFTTTYEYDSYGRLEKETSPMGFQTTYIYDSSNGRIDKIKNHKSQETIFGYDDFGRVTSTAYPDGTSTAKIFSWSAAGTNSLYCVQQTVMGKPWSKTYYDAMRRETASDVQNFNNTVSRIEKIYDSYGRLEKVSLPFFNSTSASLWNIQLLRRRQVGIY